MPLGASDIGRRLGLGNAGKCDILATALAFVRGFQFDRQSEVEQAGEDDAAASSSARASSLRQLFLAVDRDRFCVESPSLDPNAELQKWSAQQLRCLDPIESPLGWLVCNWHHEQFGKKLLHAQKTAEPILVSHVDSKRSSRLDS